MKNILFMGAFILRSSAIFSQHLPDLFGSTPKLLLDHRTLAAFPKPTWLENLVVGENGNLYVTDYPAGKILKISPSGKKELYAHIDGKIAGIAIFHKTQLLITGWDAKGQPSIFKIDKNRNVTKVMAIKGGMFPNGIIHFSSDKYLIADSYAGCIWQYDAAANSISSWLTDEMFARSSGKSEYPAANGLKLFNGDLYVSNTERQIFVKVPLSNLKPDKPELFLNRINIDDFIFDGSGNIYAATNVYNSVIKITPEKKITIIADLSSGAAGATAVVLGKNRLGRQVLFVSTSGGMAVPPPEGIEQGKIIELALK